MNVSLIPALCLTLIALFLPACHMIKAEKPQQEDHKIVVTNPKAMDVTITRQYVCQIRSQRRIKVRALVDGYLQEIRVAEGQLVKKGDVMFEIFPVLYEAKFAAEKAEAELARIEYDNTKRLFKQKVVSDQELALHQAKLDKAVAKADLAQAELKFAKIEAPFDGMVDRLHEREGSLIKERDILTSLSDNSVMWVYFNVPEVRYLEYMGVRGPDKEDLHIELVLANGSKFQYASTKLTIVANFNIENGNISFRADFPNPNGLLRDGQTGTVFTHQAQKNALVIPQRATSDILDKRYVWVVGEDDVVHQRLITIKHEQEDIYIIKSGLNVKDKIILEGVRQVRDGDKVEYDFRPPEEVLANQKNHAE